MGDDAGANELREVGSAALSAVAAVHAVHTDPTVAYLASLSPKGRTTMVERLRAVAALLDVPYAQIVWHELRFQHVDAIRQRLLEAGRSPATVNLTLAAFRGIARYARNLGLMTAEEHDRIRDVKAAKGSRLPAGRAVLAGELGALVAACAADRTPAGVRDAAIFAVLYIGGIRRSELAGLDVADWTPEPPTLRIRHGKGDKERLVPLVGAAARALNAWLRVRGARPGGLFLAITRHHTIVGTGMTSHAVYNVLGKRQREAGVAKLSPHDFRRTFVGDLLDAGVDLSTVQQLAGHASVATTARYDRRGEATKRRAVEVLHFPYRDERT
jgi:integrase